MVHESIIGSRFAGRIAGTATVPGERLKIRDVATALHVGEMPARAALQRLAALGALVNVPKAGVTVPRLTLPELDDLLQARLLLEGEAAERGAARMDAVGVRAMTGLCRRIEAAPR